jgi:hypothetical protein
MKFWLGVAAVGLSAGAFAALAPAPVGHSILHVNCPPGSHGTAPGSGAGRSLMHAREAGRSGR